jgi:hypothetical protein
MFYPQNDSNSEVRRDQLVQSSLAYWAATPREYAQPDPLAWEAGSSIPAKAGTWVWLVLAVLIVRTAIMVIVI